MLALAPAARGQEEGALPVGDWLDQGRQWVERLQENYEFGLPAAEDWTAFWNGLVGALGGDSLERLAAIRPQAETALGLLDQWPALEGYADWLRQRLDYAEMAEEIVREEDGAAPRPPAARPAAPRPPKPTEGKRITIVPLPPPPVARAPASAPRPEVFAEREERWKRRLADRPAPKRAEALVPQLKRIFREEGLSPQLVWLAEVESSMDADARSPVGAVGLFQLMPATARRFGLQTAPVDERRQPAKNARAAAQYLRFLHGRFGDWPLALAAYNAGEGRVGRILRERKAATFEQIAPHLPAETRLYVPKIAALVELREGRRLERLPAPVTASDRSPSRSG